MPLELSIPPISSHAAWLTERCAGMDAPELLKCALSEMRMGSFAMVSSFGAESVVLLHMMAEIDRSLPVIFIDTQMLFQETLDYQLAVSERLRLSDVRVIKPDADQLFLADSDGLLHRANTERCCHIRKVRPLRRALAGFDGWISGRKQVQGGARQDLPLFETDGDHLKINPLANWDHVKIQNYFQAFDLPRHPLSTRGFPSIGCAPCTSSVAVGEDPRAGRWRGSDKTECGIHFPAPTQTTKGAS